MKILLWLRSILFSLLIFPVYTVVFSIVGIGAAMLTGNRNWAKLGTMPWTFLTLRLLNVKVKTVGMENVPKGSCLFAFNHTSFMDIFALFSCFRLLKFGAKIELYKIPFVGAAMKATGALPIARDNREEAIRVLQEAEARTKLGEKFALAPEGSRGDSEKLRPFKSGPFIFAIRTQIPIVPVVIKGACQIWPKHSLIPALHSWSSEIEVHFLDPVTTTSFHIDQRQELSKIVRDKMLGYLESAV